MLSSEELNMWLICVLVSRIVHLITVIVENLACHDIINPQRACAQRVTVVLVSFIHSFIHSVTLSVNTALLEGRNQPGSESGIKPQYFTK